MLTKSILFVKINNSVKGGKKLIAMQKRSLFGFMKQGSKKVFGGKKIKRLIIN